MYRTMNGEILRVAQDSVICTELFIYSKSREYLKSSLMPRHLAKVRKLTFEKVSYNIVDDEKTFKHS